MFRRHRRSLQQDLAGGLRCLPAKLTSVSGRKTWYEQDQQTFLGSLSSSLKPYSGSSKSTPLKEVSTDHHALRKHSQNNKLNIIFLDLAGNLVETLSAHMSLSIGDQDDLPLILELLALDDDHLDGQNKSGYS